MNELRNAVNAFNPKQETIMTTNQARQYMKVSRAKIQLWRKTGLLPAIKVSESDRWLYKQSDLDKLFTDWNGYDISTAERIMIAKEQKKREANQPKSHLSYQRLAN